MKAAVAMSGGVDSSVAAALLVKQGYQVTGLTMKLWDGTDELPEDIRHSCYGPGESRDIENTQRIAEGLGIPLHVVDLSEDFRREVLDYCNREYRSGRTPNPCVKCNRSIKFEALIRKAEEAGIEFDRFATGHYSRIDYSGEKGRYLLKKGMDEKKDQSYFLAFLTQEQLSRTILPVGGYTKDEVRKLAEEFGLDMNDRPESQDFIAAGYRSVIDSGSPGTIQNSLGEILGTHGGIANFTIGQRKGLGISHPEPLYVTDIDSETGTITVGGRDDIYESECLASGLNWIAFDKLDRPAELKVKIRYSHEEAAARLVPEGEKVRISFRDPQMAITPGQAAVFYDGDTVAGAGIIERKTGP
ncbi:MAG: tRNA 2-thiouridine(34) synthase MnmA [Dehalococcoidales bacterium]|nr:tRNA 2-thiouridine(34) synthase MnmA [Dehalococcoidales bacterium]